MHSEARLSNDRQFRYWLLRVWDDSLPVGCSFGINPSTADERENDPTIRKDIGFFERLGLGGLLKLNVGAFRSTDPRTWRKSPDPIGPENTITDLLRYIREFDCSLMVAAWGKNGNYARESCAAIRDGIWGLMCFGTNPDGTPKHTLMLPYSTPLHSFHDHFDGMNECIVCDSWAGKVGKLPQLELGQ